MHRKSRWYGVAALVAVAMFWIYGGGGFNPSAETGPPHLPQQRELATKAAAAAPDAKPANRFVSARASPHAMAGSPTSVTSPPPPASAPQIEHIRYWRAQAMTGAPLALCKFARAA